MKLLIVEDEKVLLETMVAYLQKEQGICETATTYRQAEQKLIAFEYDIVVLDITLPDGNGLNILNFIKKEYPKTGVLIVSARNALEDKLQGLDMGADDYITKPFHLAELNSRINALLRRKQFDGQQLLTFQEITIDPIAKTAKVHQQTMTLTAKEFDLLLYFVTNKNRVITKQAIAEHLWGSYMENADHFDFIYTHIRNLRLKIKKAGGEDYLKTIYGLGYKYGNS